MPCEQVFKPTCRCWTSPTTPTLRSTCCLGWTPACHHCAGSAPVAPACLARSPKPRRSWSTWTSAPWPRSCRKILSMVCNVARRSAHAKAMSLPCMSANAQCYAAATLPAQWGSGSLAYINLKETGLVVGRLTAPGAGWPLMQPEDILGCCRARFPRRGGNWQT